MSTKLKLISWNVNGIRAVLKKGFEDYVKKENPDIICLQETKAMQGQAVIDLPEYTEYWHSAERKGYSGTAIFTKQQPLSVILGMGEVSENLADKYGNGAAEGRVLTLEFEKFFITTVYTPNSKDDLSRLPYRHKAWDVAFLKFVKNLEKIKPVIFCGDLNVAHQEIDLARPKDNEGEHGFTIEEREGFDNMLKAGYVDSFRMFNKEGENYTWWTNWGGARQRNIGWRIDYFLVSEKLKQHLKNAFIRPDVMGSDHCPVGIELEI